jgi:hypothetical protein
VLDDTAAGYSAKDHEAFAMPDSSMRIKIINIFEERW